MRRQAVFSKNRTYRYALWRLWDDTKPSVCFIGLNPSMADEHFDDPTTRRCIQFAKQWGFGSLSIANLFALRSTDPAALKDVQDPIGPNNNAWINTLSFDADITVACWGNNGDILNRGAEVLGMVDQVFCLDRTRLGHPKHPLYIKSKRPLIRFDKRRA